MIESATGFLCQHIGHLLIWMSGVFCMKTSVFNHSHFTQSAVKAFALRSLCQSLASVNVAPFVRQTRADAIKYWKLGGGIWIGNEENTKIKYKYMEILLFLRIIMKFILCTRNGHQNIQKASNCDGFEYFILLYFQQRKMLSKSLSKNVSFVPPKLTNEIISLWQISRFH